MECKLCRISDHGHHQLTSCNESCNHGSSHPAADYEPVAPTLSLGKRILWLTETRAASGIVKWIGRIPFISPSWSAGVEFDNPVPNGGDGDCRGRLYFVSRKGHALFLPISELITVDDNSPCNLVSREPAAIPSRFPDPYNGFYYQRHRDSTYGHFRNNFCSSCERNDYQRNASCCSHAPVYDRITSRRSLCYDDHPYETFNTGLPCGSGTNQGLVNSCYNNSQNRFVRNEYHQNIITTDNCSRNSTIIHDGSHANYQQDPEEIFPDVSLSRKDSFFSSRSSSFRLISGIKEWVSCWVLGVTKQKRESNIFIRGRKTIASLIVSRGSPSLTGQRLSSFSDYDTFNEFGSFKKDVRPAAKYLPQTKCKIVEAEVSRGNHSRRKKRQAPLPPVQSPFSTEISNMGSNQTTTVYYNRQTNSGKIKSLVRSNEIVKDELVAQQKSKPTVIVSHVNSVKRSRKKRQAPLPPNLITVNRSNNQNTNSYSSVNSKLNQLHHMNRKEKLKYAQNVLEKINKEELSLTNPKLSRSSRKTFIPAKSTVYIDSLTESDSENNQDGNKVNSVYFSGDESEDEKYGLVKYGMVRQGNLETLNSNQRDPNENHTHYKDDNDVCLKISIKKLETNVVTVEDINGSRVSQYTIEEETSVSELSEEDDVLMKEKKSSACNKSKRSTSESSSMSTDDVPEKSKTIFDELKLKPPSKRSVKDFVQAFNMLATKGDQGNNEKNVSYKETVQKDKKESPSTASNSVKSLGTSALYAIQSFPTKWEYQTNQLTNIIYPTNQFLMPIAEESNNDTSEYDKNTSVEDVNVIHPNINNSKGKQRKCKDLLNGKLNLTSDSKSKACTHCFEPHKDHTSEAHFKSHKKKAITLGSKPGCREAATEPENRDRKQSTSASVAALASLLCEKAKPGTSKVEEAVKNTSSKPDQPIMVSLYIEDKSSHRGPIPLLVTPSMSLRKLKKQVEKEYKFPRDQQCWILGESFAVRDDISLANYGVTDIGCPILLYVMGKDSKSKSLPSRPQSRSGRKTSSHFESSTSSESESDKPRKGKAKSGNGTVNEDDGGRHAPSHSQKKYARSGKRSPSKKLHRKHLDASSQKAKKDYHAMWDADYQKKQDYRTLVELDDVDLVANTEPFECPVCFVDIAIGDGAILQECLHTFCRECLAGAIQFSDTAVIRCPFRNDEYSCECHLQEREIKTLVPPNVYEKHLQRSMALAESQAEDSFHCKTPDCQGWCLYEDNVNTFLCPVCKHTNCLTCAAIHEGKNCRQFQDDVAFRCDSSEEAKKTKEYLENMVRDGEAMECPKCQVILMKKWGCDWLKCSMCHTEVCWVTKGPRWGPAGKGDTSAGCKCMLNGVRCHPKCSYCH